MPGVRGGKLTERQRQHVGVLASGVPSESAFSHEHLSTASLVP